MIETLGSRDWEYFIGIAELQNEQKLTKEGFVDLASQMAEGLLVVQFMRTDFIAGIEHLLSASENAINAWQGGYMISRNLDIEVVLYASAQRQIDKALEDIGTIDGLESVALVVIGKLKEQVEKSIARAQQRVGRRISPPFQVSEDRIQHICEHFSIADTELNAITSSTNLEHRYDAVKKSVMSRVSMVALEA
ncbi:MAG: KEOPS complex subunit Cgi121 [Candidatus Thorarchaeota archaeon]